MRACSFKGCGKAHAAKGFCTGHYAQFRRGGGLKPLRERKHDQPVGDLIWEPVFVSWMAGIIEGEGYFGYTSGAVRVRVSMSDKDVIETLFEKSQIGKIFVQNRIEDDRPRKTMYTWEVRRYREIEFLIEALKPYMHSRRTAKMVEIEKFIAGRQAIKNCTFCGKIFETKMGFVTRQVYCSSDCRVEAQKERGRLK